MSQLVPHGPASLDRLEDCDANMYTDWTREDKKMQLQPLDCLNLGLPTGVQTPTTPTITPTTLRVIAAEILSLPDADHTHPYHNEAGFVPPVVSSSASTYMVDSKSWQGGSVTTMAEQPYTPAVAPTSAAPPPPALSVSPPAQAATPARKNVGGRRPNKAKGISPEEEERRQVRRERNKAAAARCRKRRMDHTNELIIETEGLESKKQALQLEIHDLKSEVEELKYLLDSHRLSGSCCLSRPERCASPPDIKPLVYPVKLEQPDEQETSSKRSLPAMVPPPAQCKPPRPTSLPVPPHNILRSSASEIAGISITTPSTGIPLNFDSLMDGGTGLTPVSGPLVPSCSSQQRNQNCVDLSSPDSNIGNKLVSL